MDLKSQDVPYDFIREIIARDRETGKNEGRVHTRFPPEPNGYLHIGHAKAIFLNFGAAAEFDGVCNLRFDDTNPSKESVEYVHAIMEDVRWLGFDWQDRLFYASDYFPQLFEFALQLIREGKAYVCDLSAEQIRAYRGTLTEPGRESPHRNRPEAENLDLFHRMRSGEFPDGSRVLRARIDMAAGNINLRDPVMYRVLHVPHHRTGTEWPIYPTYDFAHGLSDYLEGITHSLCSLEFEDHRPLYDWYLDALRLEHHPRQIEFARLNLTHTVLSKRRLQRLVASGAVRGWDDPRLPTIAGMKRRGYTPQAIGTFCRRIGVGKRESTVDLALLEHCLREDLNLRAPRRMGVLNPLRVVIENYPEERTEDFEAVNNPEDETMGTRSVPFSKVIYVERDDFLEAPPKKWYRLAPGREVRLRYAYYITCTEAVRDRQTGEVTELRCTYDPESRGGSSPDGRRVRGTLHWVSAGHSIPAQVRLYHHLFPESHPAEEASDGDISSAVNPGSLEVLDSCRVEPSLADMLPGDRFQFERLGYFCIDPVDKPQGRLVLNRSVSLRDSWSKIRKSLEKKQE